MLVWIRSALTNVGKRRNKDFSSNPWYAGHWALCFPVGIIQAPNGVCNFPFLSVHCLIYFLNVPHDFPSGFFWLMWRFLVVLECFDQVQNKCAQKTCSILPARAASWNSMLKETKMMFMMRTTSSMTTSRMQQQCQGHWGLQGIV